MPMLNEYELSQNLNSDTNKPFQQPTSPKISV